MFVRLLSRRAFATRSDWQQIDRQLWLREITPQKATKAYRAAVSDDKNKKDMELLSRYALLLYRNKAWTELQSTYKAIDKLDRGRTLAKILEALHRFTTDSKSSLKTVIRNTSGRFLTPLEHRCISLVYLKSSLPFHALKSMNKYFSGSVSTSPDPFATRERLQAELRCKEFASALHTCDDLLRIDPRSVEARYLRARALFGDGKSIDAIMELTKLLDVGKGELTGQQRAFILQRRSDYRGDDLSGRIADLKRAHDLCPNLGCDRELVTLYYEKQMTAEQADLLGRITRTNDYVVELARADMSMHKKDYAAARLGYERARGLAATAFKADLKRSLGEIEAIMKKPTVNSKKK